MSISLFVRTIRLLFSGDNFRDELNEEMQFHRAAAEQAFKEQAMAVEAARYAAQRQFGNTTRFQEQSNEIVGFRIETVLQDLRFALRQSRKNPGFAATTLEPSVQVRSIAPRISTIWTGSGGTKASYLWTRTPGGTSC